MKSKPTRSYKTFYHDIKLISCHNNVQCYTSEYYKKCRYILTNKTLEILYKTRIYVIRYIILTIRDVYIKTISSKAQNYKFKN